METSRTPTARSLGRKVAPALVLGTMLFGLTACGGGSKTETSADTSSSVSSSTSSSSTSTTALRQPCTPANLVAAAAAGYPGAEINDVTCSAAFAVATLVTSRGTNVAFFGAQPDGTWAVLNVGGVSADLAGLTPAGLPESLTIGWKSRYESRINNPSTGVPEDVVDDGLPPSTEPPPTEPPPPETEPPAEEPPAEEVPAE